MSEDKETVFDYDIKPEIKDWAQWEAEEWIQPKIISFSQLLIPTIDSTRAESIIISTASFPDIRNEIRKERRFKLTLIVGGVGTDKTSCALMYSSKLDPSKMLLKSINF